MVPPSRVTSTRNVKERNWASLFQALVTELPKRSVVRKNSIIVKDEEGERLVGAVRRTLNGESPLDEELAMRLLRSLALQEVRSPRPAPPSPELTPQELEVLRLLALGQTNRQIARNLLSSVSTVK